MESITLYQSEMWKIRYGEALNYIFRMYERRLRRLCTFLSLGPPISPFDGTVRQRPPEHRVYVLLPNLELEIYANDIDINLPTIEKMVKRMRRVVESERVLEIRSKYAVINNAMEP